MWNNSRCSGVNSIAVKKRYFNFYASDFASWELYVKPLFIQITDFSVMIRY